MRAVRRALEPLRSAPHKTRQPRQPRQPRQSEPCPRAEMLLMPMAKDVEIELVDKDFDPFAAA